MKIGHKLILGFAGIAMLTAIVGTISIFQNRKIQRIAEKEVYTSISHLNDVWTLMEAQEHMEIAANNYLFLDIGLRERRADYFYEKERLEKTYQRYYRKSCVHVKASLEMYHENMKIYSTKIEEIFELSEQGADLEMIKEKVREATKFVEIAHEDALEPIIEHVYKEHIEPAKNDIAKGINRTTATAITMSGIAVFLAIGLGFFIARSISGPIRKLHKGTEVIGAGNLDYKVGTDAKDEIGQLSRAFDTMTEDLKKTTTSIDKLNKEIVEREKVEEKLRKAMNIKSQFTSMVSHELRTPLTAIGEGINIVLDGITGSINKEQRDLLEISGRNVNRLTRLINDVLDFQKLESGRMQFRIQENDINDVVKEVYETMQTVTKENKLDFAIKLEENLPKIKFDKDNITQVLTNLVNNAIKFTKKGNITIKTKKEANTIHVMVEDTGQGIKKEDMPKLFQSFQQLGVRKTGGTGLGLAISKEIIMRHKGRIWAESEFGKGTIFHFVLLI